MRRSRLLGLVLTAASLAAPVARAKDLSGRVILSFDSYGTERLSTSGFRQLYDLRLEKRLTDPFFLRLSFRGERTDTSSELATSLSDQNFTRFQPAAELNYSLPTFQLQGTWFRDRTRASSSQGAETERVLRRATGRLGWRPQGLPGVALLAEDRGVKDPLFGVERNETLAQGAIDYNWRGLTVVGTSRRTELDDGQAQFARRSFENQGSLVYEGSLWRGRVIGSANLLYSVTRLDERATGGPTEVPTQVPVLRALYANDDTPTDEVDRPPVELPELIDGDRETPTEVLLGPEGDSYQNVSLDIGRVQELDGFEVHVRDIDRDRVPFGGSVQWDVYASVDGLRWVPVPGQAVTRFVAPLSLYEVRFPLLASRYFKLVSLGTSTIDTRVSEVEAYYHTELGAQETRRTDIRVGSGTASLAVRPQRNLVFSYFGTLSDVQQTSERRPDSVSTSSDHLLAAGLERLGAFDLQLRHQRRNASQPSGYRQSFDATTAIVRYQPNRALEESFELLRSHDDNAGILIDTSGVAFKTLARLYRAIDLRLDVGVQRQEYLSEGRGVDRFFLTGVGRAQLLPSLRLMLTANIQRSRYEDGEIQLPGFEGLPPRRDVRWEADVFYRPSTQLGVGVRLGRASTERVSGTIQRYHLEWYPLPGGALAFTGTYDQDVNAAVGRTSRRLLLTPTWRINRRMVLTASYILIDTTGALGTRTTSFYATLTLNL